MTILIHILNFDWLQTKSYSAGNIVVSPTKSIMVIELVGHQVILTDIWCHKNVDLITLYPPVNITVFLNIFQFILQTFVIVGLNIVFVGACHLFFPQSMVHFLHLAKLVKGSFMSPSD